jgi:hypothetical protein
MIAYSSLFLLSAVAWTAQAQSSAPSGAKAPPAAREGFQLGIRPNVQVPLGPAFGDVDLSQLSTALVGVDVDIGWKVIPNLFLGGRTSVGIGGVGDANDLICLDDRATCIAVRVGLGAEVQYHFRPSARMNPWIGYGFGLDVLTLNRSARTASVKSSFIGFDFAHLSGGLDWRLSRGFGIGLFVDFAMGMYFEESLTIDDGRDRSARASDSIDDTAMHYWLSLGPRFVIFP